jgi:hypothetical protein
LWFFAATFSFFWNIGTENVFKHYLGGFVAPLIVYLALRNLPLSKRLFNQIMIALSLGIIAVLILGIAVYYKTWGIPGITTLIFSRYDQQRMKIYRQMMFGNVGNAAQLLIFIGPVFLALALDRGRAWLLRSWFGGCFLLVLANLAIVGARAGFLVMTVAILLCFYYYRRLGRFFIIAALVVGVCWILLPYLSRNGINLFLERMYNSITLNREADYSIYSRIEAIKEGWNVFCNNWLAGVGPGSSNLYISALSAHQVFVQQGVELGIVGFFATVMLVLTVFWRLAKVMFSKALQTFRVERFVILLGVAMYFFYGILANLTTNIGIVNIWANLMAAFLALADFREVSVDSRTSARRGLAPDGAPGTVESEQVTVEERKDLLEVRQPVEGELAPGTVDNELPPNGGPDTSWQLRSG